MQTIQTIKKTVIDDLAKIHLEKYAETLVEYGIAAINIKTYSLKESNTNIIDIKNNGLSAILNLFKPKPPVQKELIKDSLPIGSSKIGGHPDLPEDFTWPYNKETPLTLLAQFNLRDIKDYDLTNMLPKTGMLYFFYDSEEMPWGDHKDDKTGWKILYTENINNLIRVKHPDYKANDYYFNPCKLSFETFLSLPGIEKIYYKSKIKFTDEEEEEYLNYTFDPLNQSEYHNLLGYPMVIQNEEMEIDCEKNSNITTASNKKEDQEQLKKDLQEWVLLLQLDTDTKTGMMWGDCGRLYFWIKKEDLQNKNFNNVWMIFQCY